MPCHTKHSNLLTLVASRDYSTFSGGGGLTQRLLKPMSMELRSAQVQMIRRRQQLIKELYEQEFEDQSEELSKLKLSLKALAWRYRCTPLGLLPVWQ
ncbi:CG34210 [Drosophila busckii]|uniref:CG34210 n=1 Tax=Drosophila busckii TaxID=30019 RepID=A0A0M4E932_DROBS|nr:uncharacterized protein LOC108595817 [Drosophila busckii]ALC41346.1 CG34210 [Drosophila busckii]